jgi:hypothetical protein
MTGPASALKQSHRSKDQPTHSQSNGAVTSRSDPLRIANSSSSSRGGTSRRVLFTEQSPVDASPNNSPSLAPRSAPSPQRSLSRQASEAASSSPAPPASLNRRNWTSGRSNSSKSPSLQSVEMKGNQPRTNFEELLAERFDVTAKKYDDNPMRSSQLKLSRQHSTGLKIQNSSPPRSADTAGPSLSSERLPRSKSTQDLQRDFNFPAESKTPQMRRAQTKYR